MTEEKQTCPKCGESVSKDDNFCRKCGAQLTRQPSVTSVADTTLPIPPEMPPPSPPPPPYQRKFSTSSRLLGVMFKPYETMMDIAMAPDYAGVIIILVGQVILSVIAFAFALSKVEITGPYASLFWSIAVAVAGAVLAISFILQPVRWLIKSVIVWKLGDSRSRWQFKSAASVTGYAYIANLIVSLVTMPLLPFIFPSVRIDFSSLEIARLMVDDLVAQLTRLQIYYMLPSLFVALLWKSFLGAVGTSYGTKQFCKASSAFILFFLLGLITIALSFIRY